MIRPVTEIPRGIVITVDDFGTPIAIVAPLPMLCMGTVYVLKPFEGDAPITDTVPRLRCGSP